MSHQAAAEQRGVKRRTRPWIEQCVPLRVGQRDDVGGGSKKGQILMKLGDVV